MRFFGSGMYKAGRAGVTVVACPLCATTGAVVVDDLAQFIDGCGRPVLMLRRELGRW